MKTTAVVRLAVEVHDVGYWRGDARMDEVQQQAASAAVQFLERVARDQEGGRLIIKSHRVILVMVEEDAPPTGTTAREKT